MSERFTKNNLLGIETPEDIFWGEDSTGDSDKDEALREMIVDLNQWQKTSVKDLDVDADAHLKYIEALYKDMCFLFVGLLPDDFVRVDNVPIHVEELPNRVHTRAFEIGPLGKVRQNPTEAVVWEKKA